MALWNNWFESISDIQIQRGHLPRGRELTNDGVKDLPWGKDSLTGFTFIEAEDLDTAESIAAKCPIVKSTLVYEVMPG